MLSHPAFSATCSGPAYKGPPPERVPRPCPAQTINEEEAQALAAYGVDINDSHLDGYKYTADLPTQFRRPCGDVWEGAVREFYGHDVMICESIETWNNPEFLFEAREGIAYWTINAPPNNYFTHCVTSGMIDGARILGQTTDFRLCVMTGTGNMFCGGGDPRGFQESQRAAGVVAGDAGDWHPENPQGPHIACYGQYMDPLKNNIDSAIKGSNHFYSWNHLSVFSIILKNGSSMGGALGILAGGDYVVAVKRAYAVLSEVRLGVIPAVVSPHVIRAVGTANAKQIFCTAENLTALRAMEVGLVQKVVAHEREFAPCVKELAERLQALAPGAVRTAKKIILGTVNAPSSMRLFDYVVQEYAKVRKTDECREGMELLASRKIPAWDKHIDVKEYVEVKKKKEKDEEGKKG